MERKIDMILDMLAKIDVSEKSKDESTPGPSPSLEITPTASPVLFRQQLSNHDSQTRPCRSGLDHISQK